MYPSHWSKFHTIALLTLLFALVYLALAIKEHLSLVEAWFTIMGIVTMFMLILGHGITGAWRGVFIDDRNVISLSRVQILAWTVLILSAFMAGVFWNIACSIPQPLDQVKLDATLWMLMGISSTSLVASPLILSRKKIQTPSAEEMQSTFDLISKEGGGEQKSQGLIVANKEISQASWTDMFTGEETSNAAHVDLSRVQMFFFTIVSLITYGVVLGDMLHNSTKESGVTNFPGLPEGLLALIGISHAGYLSMKAMPVSQTGSTSVPTVDPVNDQPAVG